MKQALALLLSALVIVASASEEYPEDACRLWMAPSTTTSPAAPKLGLYAGVNYEQNATVGRPEIAIPLIDFMNNWNRQTELDSRILDFLEGYCWTGDYAGSKFESVHSNVAAIPGYGILANYHSGTFNVDWVPGSVLLRDRSSVTKQGVAHPSRGAITPFYNLTMKATQSIKAGMEIFANFGEVWDGNHTDDIFQDKLTRWDYMQADQVLDKILEFMNKYDDEMTPKIKEEVLDFLFGKVLGTAAGSRAKVIRSLLPSHPGKLQAVKDMGGTFQYRNTDLVKTPKWLRKHGTCMDNLKSGISTISEAGRGAFATRKISKGDVVAPAPMLQIPNKDLMKMYAFETFYDDGENGEYLAPNKNNEPIGQQLMINYCYGHPESSLLLLPIGGIMNLINHKPTGKGANAKIQWSNHKHWGNRGEVAHMSPENLVNPRAMHIHIVMEIVATRDIEKDEEVFIDYGSEWAEAWDEYMKGWNAKHGKDSKWSLKAEDLVEEYKTKPYKTQSELKNSPYPTGVTTACFTLTKEVEDGEARDTEDGTPIAIWVGPTSFEKISGLNMQECEIVGRSEKPEDGSFYNYTARMELADEMYEVKEIPQYAITMIDKPYTSDIFAKDTFRHSIGIPDAMFPQAWRDLRD